MKADVCEVFKAVSEPVRLRILVMLTRGELCVCDLQEVLGLPQSTVSRHLSRLKLLGLAADRRAGRWVYYRLARMESAVGMAVTELLPRLVTQEPYRGDGRRLEEYGATKGYRGKGRNGGIGCGEGGGGDSDEVKRVIIRKEE